MRATWHLQDSVVDKKLITASRSWALKASTNRWSVSMVALPVPNTQPQLSFAPLALGGDVRGDGMVRRKPCNSARGARPP
jgi:hypothetical protein